VNPDVQTSEVGLLKLKTRAGYGDRLVSVKDRLRARRTPEGLVQRAEEIQ
jgi:hypothetical protein